MLNKIVKGLLVSGLVLSLAMTAAAQDAPLPENVVAANLTEPRGLAYNPDGMEEVYSNPTEIA